jgi:hypothetical protein
MNRLALLGLALLATALAGAIALELGGGGAAEDATGIVALRHAPLSKARAVSEDPVDHTDEWVATVLGRPLFSRDRRPTPMVAKAGGEAPMSSLPRLTGVMVGPFGRNAIFAGPDGGKPITLAEGATLGVYTVQSIAPGRVTVSGPDGVRELEPSYDAVARRAVAAETPQQQLPVRPQGLNIRPGSQFQRALSAVDGTRPAPQFQQQSVDQ